MKLFNKKTCVLHFSSERDNSREISQNGQGRRLSRFRSIRKYVIIKLNKYHDTTSGNSTNVTDMVSVKLSTISGDNVRPMSCYVVNQIHASTPPVDASKYDYLRNLRFPCNVRVDFLIGQDNAGILVPLEVRHGVDNELFATRTLYGWCGNGPAMT